MKKTARITAVVAAGAILLSGATAAVAGGSNVSYSTTVGSFNGSGYTAYQDKTTHGATGFLNSGSVGGNYTVDARMLGTDGTAGSWARTLSDGTSHYLYNNVSSSANARVEFSNDAFTPVSVQVSGSWRSN
jgi:hypothetical protein